MPNCLRRSAVLFAIGISFTLPAVGVADETEATKPHHYDPVELDVEGWTIKADPRLVKGEDKELGDQAFAALRNHLQRIRYIVPDERVEEMQKLPIWIEKDNAKLGNMQYHPSRRWLQRNGHDPQLAKHVHIPRARALLDRRTWAKHPYVVLHELAHAYHDQVLGFDNPKVIEAFKQAQERKLYDKVLVHTGREAPHYATTNHKEYFAEMTESYFGVNDFYPFVRAELKTYDRPTFAMLEAIWGKVP